MGSNPSFPPGKIDADEARAKPSEPPAKRSVSSRPAPPPSPPPFTALERAAIERPPMSMSAIPAEQYPPPPGSQPRQPIGPPVLASDILRDDVAPIAPAQREIVLWLILFSLGFGIAAILSWLTFIPQTVLIGAAATAGVAALAALLPVPYTLRALFAAIAGLVPLVLGAEGDGPLSAMHMRGGHLDLATLVALTFLPGVLLFRSRYRAFAAARVLLAIALVLSIPAEIGFALTALDSAAPLVTRVADGVVFVAVLGSCFGFMGAETTAFGAFWGALIVTTHASGIGFRALTSGAGGHGWMWISPPRGAFIAGGVGEWVAATLAAHAIFQLLAALLAKQARRVDVHRIVGPSAETESDPDRIGEDDRAESLSDDR